MSQKNKFKEFFMSSWAIDNRTTTYVLTAIVVLLGLVSFNNLPKENFPEITIPTIYIGTPYPGTTPERMEKTVTYYIEKELASIDGVKEIKSQSIQDYSMIIVEFETSVDIDEAKKECKDGVDRAKANLPSDLPQDPLVQDINLSEIPIVFLNVYGNLDNATLKRNAEELQDEIEGLTEIKRVDLVGADELEVQVNLDLYKMQAREVAFGDINQAIQRRDVIISGGNVDIGNKSYSIQVNGQFTKTEQIENLVVRNGKGRSVFLRDLLPDGERIKLKPKDKESYARLDGSQVITLNVIKKSGENLIDAIDQIDKIKADFMAGLPPDLKSKINVISSADQSQLTKNMLKDLINTIIIGFILVTIVLMFFMGLRDATFVGLSVPLSSLIAFVVLPFLGFTMNLVVLFTFIFALGIVVDNAIVVIENTHRIFNTEKIPIRLAAKKAAGEVIAPVFAGTLTTMAPFLPLAFWEGIIGEFMFFLPITIIITLSASLLVAYVINPVFAVTFMKRSDLEKGISLRGWLIRTGLHGLGTAGAYLSGNTTMGNVLLIILILLVSYRFITKPSILFFQRRIIPWMMNGYRKILVWSLKGKRPLLVLGGTMGLFVLSFMVLGANPPKIIFFPEADPNFIYVYNESETSTNIERTNEITKELEQIVYDVLGRNNPVVKSVITNVAVGAGTQNDFNQTSSIPNKSKIGIEFVPFKERQGISTRVYMDEIRKRVAKVAGKTSVVVEKEASGPPTEKPINIEIAGEDFKQIMVAAGKLKDHLENLIKAKKIQGVEKLEWDLDLGKKELRVDLDHNKASEMGLFTDQVALALRTAVFGSEVSQFRVGEDEYPIMVRLEERFRKDVDQLEDIRINFLDMATGGFKNIPISAVAQIDDSTTFGGLNRIDLEKVVVISSNVLSEFNPNEVVFGVIDEMESWKKANPALANGLRIEMTGQLQEQAETSAFLGSAMLISLMLIFLILISQFNSFPKVFIILTQIIFSMVGVFLGFGLAGIELSIVMVGIGIVSLAGIVVNNGIILLDFIQIQKDRGLRTRESIIEGSATRFSPVLLTASSTILGLIPLAAGLNLDFASLFTDLDPQIYFGGDNSAFWGPLGLTIIFGLSFATFVTLLVVPNLYYLFYVNGIWIGRRVRRARRRIGKLVS